MPERKDLEHALALGRHFQLAQVAGQLPAGARGAQGPPGAAGATKVVVRLASSAPGVTAGLPEVAFVSCVGSELATGGGLTLHVRLIDGDDPQHVLEAIFKALGVALAQAGRPRKRKE